MATDPCLNTTEAQQVIAVVDNQAPVMETLGTLTISCEEAIPTTLPEATDNCGSVLVTETTEVISGDCSGELHCASFFRGHRRLWQHLHV